MVRERLPSVQQKQAAELKQRQIQAQISEQQQVQRETQAIERVNILLEQQRVIIQRQASREAELKQRETETIIEGRKIGNLSEGATAETIKNLQPRLQILKTKVAKLSKERRELQIQRDEISKKITASQTGLSQERKERSSQIVRKQERFLELTKAKESARTDIQIRSSVLAEVRARREKLGKQKEIPGIDVATPSPEGFIYQRGKLPVPIRKPVETRTQASISGIPVSPGVVALIKRREAQRITEKAGDVLTLPPVPERVPLIERFIPVKAEALGGDIFKTTLLEKETGKAFDIVTGKSPALDVEVKPTEFEKGLKKVQTVTIPIDLKEATTTEKTSKGLGIGFLGGLTSLATIPAELGLAGKEILELPPGFKRQAILGLGGKFVRETKQFAQEEPLFFTSSLVGGAVFFKVASPVFKPITKPIARRLPIRSKISESFRLVKEEVRQPRFSLLGLTEEQVQTQSLARAVKGLDIRDIPGGRDIPKQAKTGAPPKPPKIKTFTPFETAKILQEEGVLKIMEFKKRPSGFDELQFGRSIHPPTAKGAIIQIRKDLPKGLTKERILGHELWHLRKSKSSESIIHKIETKPFTPKDINIIIKRFKSDTSIYSSITEGKPSTPKPKIKFPESTGIFKPGELKIIGTGKGDVGIVSKRLIEGKPSTEVLGLVGKDVTAIGKVGRFERFVTETEFKGRAVTKIIPEDVGVIDIFGKPISVGKAIKTDVGVFGEVKVRQPLTQFFGKDSIRAEVSSFFKTRQQIIKARQVGGFLSKQTTQELGGAGIVTETSGLKTLVDLRTGRRIGKIKGGAVEFPGIKFGATAELFPKGFTTIGKGQAVLEGEGVVSDIISRGTEKPGRFETFTQTAKEQRGFRDISRKQSLINIKDLTEGEFIKRDVTIGDVIKPSKDVPFFAGLGKNGKPFVRKTTDLIVKEQIVGDFYAPVKKGFRQAEPLIDVSDVSLQAVKIAEREGLTFTEFKPGKQRQGLITIQLTKTDTKITQLQATKQAQKLKVKQEIIQLTREKPGVKQKTFLTQAQPQAQEIISIQKLGQVQAQAQKQAVIQLTETKPALRTVTPSYDLFRDIDITVPFVPPPTTPPPTFLKRKKKRGQLFKIEVKRFGKFKEIGRAPKGEAILIGRRRAKKTLGATFKLTPTDIPAISRVSETQARQVLGKEFREFKIVKGAPKHTPLTFIQKRGFRLGTTGEVLEIQRARSIASSPFAKPKRKKKKTKRRKK